MDIVFATHNANKVREVVTQLPAIFTVKSLNDIGYKNAIPEEGKTLEDNAIIKAQTIYNYCGVDCFADDTGLEVNALDGLPGVYSARYAGDQCNSKDNIKKLFLALSHFTNRTAQFRTVVALFVGGILYTFEGIVHGEITKKQMGVGGFGYDSIFLPKGYNQTFAQLSIEEKNRISHRGRAISKLVEFLKKQY